MNPCLSIQAQADLTPQVKFEDVSKERFESMVKTMKYSHCQTSLMCAKSIKNCMKKMASGNEPQNQHFVQCFADREVQTCINKIAQ